MNREQAYEMVKKNVKNKNLVKHMLAVEAVMKALARHLGEDEEMWGLAGLAHDVDLGKTLDKPRRHAIVGGEMLEKAGATPAVVQAVRAHNHVLNLPRKSPMDKALYAADPLTGLIVAAALIHPAKKLEALDKDFVLNRFKEKHFAKGAGRKQISACSELGLSLEDFIDLGLEAMQAEAKNLGL